jgi:molybdate transport system substrate-binding protein
MAEYARLRYILGDISNPSVTAQAIGRDVVKSVNALIGLVGLLAVSLCGEQSYAAQTNVAVAANFTDAVKEIAAAFKQKTGHEAVLSFGSSGALYTQITQDAPFQIMLSADTERPKKLVDDGLAVADSRFTYAIGKLVLWSKNPDFVKGEGTLKSATFAKLSICDPVAAPYGAAAVETMKSLKLYDALQPKLVQGANITQAFQFVDTGNAEVGFVAASQLINRQGSRWVVPQDLYEPIRQDAVLLKKGAGNEAAVAFMKFLKGPEAHAVIEKYGYAFDNSKS